MRVPLVAGEEPTGVQRVLVVADSGNGVSAVLPFDRWLFINTELTVHFRREPRGEWICLDAETSIAHGGAGLARSVLSDDEGVVAQGAQALLVSERAPDEIAQRQAVSGRCLRTHSCIATADAAAALIERVEPNWRIASTAVASSRASGERPGPSWPNSSTQRSGSG